MDALFMVWFFVMRVFDTMSKYIQSALIADMALPVFPETADVAKVWQDAVRYANKPDCPKSSELLEIFHYLCRFQISVATGTFLSLHNIISSKSTQAWVKNRMEYHALPLVVRIVSGGQVVSNLAMPADVRSKMWLRYIRMVWQMEDYVPEAHFHFIVKGSRAIKRSIYRNIPWYMASHAKCQGMIAQSKQTIRYAKDVLKANKDIILNEAVKSIQKEGKVGRLSLASMAISIAELRERLSEVLNIMMNGHPVGKMTMDLRGRFYAEAITVITYQSSKLLRACIEVSHRCSWSEIEEVVIQAYGSLVGAKGKTWKAFVSDCHRKWNTGIKSFKNEIPVTNNHEAIWAWRLLREYFRMQDNPNHVWSVPIELDQHASFVSYYGALFGVKELLVASNTISNSRGYKHNYYAGAHTFDETRRKILQAKVEACKAPAGLVKALRKDFGTPTGYGASIEQKNPNGESPLLSLLRKGRNTRPYIEASGLSVEQWYKQNSVLCKAVWDLVREEPTTGIASQICEAVSRYITNFVPCGTMKLDMGRGDAIIAQTSHFEQELIKPENNGEPYWADKPIYAQERMPKRIGNSNTNLKQKFVWVMSSGVFNVPKYFTPSAVRFIRYMPTALVHHQDAVTADWVSYKLIMTGYWCVTVHDAFIVHPAAAARCHELVQERMWDVYSHRHEILTAFFGNFNVKLSAVEMALTPYGYESAPSLTKADFMAGQCLK